jgi:hypothetical protein
MQEVKSTGKMSRSQDSRRSSSNHAAKVDPGERARLVDQHNSQLRAMVEMADKLDRIIQREKENRQQKPAKGIDDPEFKQL